MSNWNGWLNEDDDSEFVEVRKSYSDQELAKMLSNEGYTAIKFFKNGVLAFTAKPWTYLLSNTENTLQIAVSFSDEEVSLETLNEWNSNYCFARAYKNDGDKIYLDHNLDLRAGVSKEQIVRFIKKFIFITEKFWGCSRLARMLYYKNEDNPL